MKTKVNIFTADWCNLVFEGKNKNYGAYELRQRSSKRHAIAILLSVSFFALGVSAPVLLKSISPEKKWTISEETVLTDVTPSKPEEVKIPELPVPQVRKMERFVAPEITTEEIEQETTPIIEELLQSSALIGNREQEGGIDPTLPTEGILQITEEPEAPRPFVEQMPEYPGGDAARMLFFKNNMRYPSIAAEMGISGRVILQFVVDKNGNIDRIKVLRGLGGGCDEEAMRVVKLMPPWKPGRQNGKAVPVYFTFPVVFALQN